MRKGIGLFLCGSAIVLAVAAALPLSASAGERVVRIGVCLSTSGEFHAAGRKAVAGIKMRAEEFNAESAATGVRLELVFRDDQSTVEGGTAIIEELAGDESVAAIIGPLSTLQMLPMAETARRLGIVLLSPTVTNPKIGRNGDWAFRLLFDDEFQGTALARYMGGKLGLRRAAAIFNGRLAYAESVLGSFKRVMEELGGEMVAEERYEWVADEEAEHPFRSILERVTAAGPEVTLLPVNSTEVATIIRESLSTDLETIFCGGDTWQHESILLSSGNNLEGSYFISGINFASGSPAMEHYLKIFDQSHDPDAQLTSVLGYDSLSLLIEAMQKGHDREAIREGLYGIRNFELACGTITIDRERGSEKSAFIQRIRREDGEFVAEVIGELKP